jgi:transmembrane sensor
MSPTSDPSDLLLVMYLAGDCTAAETREIVALLATSPALRRRLDDLRRVLGAEPPATVWDADAIWARVRGRSVDADAGHPRVAPTVAGDEQALRHGPVPLRTLVGERWTAQWSAAAALLLIVGGAATLWFATRDQHRIASAALKTSDGHYSTSRAQYATITLSDGSRVTLAPESRLTIPARFGEGTRDIVLDGEAIFNVRHDAAHPFRVRARGAMIEDVGTRFDLRAYGNDATVTVAVAEGAVTLGRTRSDSAALRDADGDGIVLRRGDVGALNDRGRTTSTHGVAVGRYFGWANGNLSFVSRPLPEVLRSIGRWYDLDVRAQDPALTARLVTAEFSTQSPSQMIDALALAASATVERQGRVVILRAK